MQSIRRHLCCAHWHRPFHCQSAKRRHGISGLHEVAWLSTADMLHVAYPLVCRAERRETTDEVPFDQRMLDAVRKYCKVLKRAELGK